jgi:hypothetical protein
MIVFRSLYGTCVQVRAVHMADCLCLIRLQETIVFNMRHPRAECGLQVTVLPCLK